jgi:hypothetical protein
MMDASMTPDWLGGSWRDDSACLDEEIAQHRTVTARFILTIAPDGEVGLTRQRRERFDQVP